MPFFREPWVIGIIVLVIFLLFFAPKLPAMARSLGQSFRIIKSEVRESKNDGKQQPTTSGQQENPVEGTVVNPPPSGVANPAENRDGTGRAGASPGNTTA